MRFFVDTANIEEIRKANEMGIICGVTTNPSLIAKEGRDFKQVIDCARAGADIATVPYGVLVQMTKHPLTDQGIIKFQEDYRKVFGE